MIFRVSGVSVIFAIGFLASLVACSSKRAPTAELMPSPQGAPGITGAPNPLKTVFFHTDKFQLTKEAQTELRANVDWLKKNPIATVRVEGHCDERGTAAYNLKLGERRAEAVKKYLISRGVPPFRVSALSYGYSRPVDPGHSDAAWAANRRVESVVSSRNVTYYSH